MTTLLVISVFLSTAVALLGDVGGLRITAVGWLAPLCFALLVLSRSIARPLGNFFVWLPWATLVLLSAIASSHDNALHRAIVILTPLLVGLAASTLSFRDHGIVLLRRAIVLLAILGVPIVAIKVLTANQVDRYLFLAAESTTMVLLAWVAVHIYFFYRERVAIIIWCAALIVPVFAISRAATAIAISSIFLTLAPVRLRVRIASLFATAALALAVVATSGFLEKTVGEASLADVVEDPAVVQTSGRLAVWAFLFERVPEKLWLGHGANASQTELVRNVDFFDHPHNDWLRIAFDYGVIGLTLFTIGAIGLLAALLKIARTHTDRDTKFAAYTAASLFLPFFFLMMTDNILLYCAYFGNIHFLFVGSALSMGRRIAKVEWKGRSSSDVALGQ